MSLFSFLAGAGGQLLASEVYRLLPNVFGLNAGAAADDVSNLAKELNLQLFKADGEGLPLFGTATGNKGGGAALVAWAQTRFNATTVPEILTALKGALPYLIGIATAMGGSKANSIIPATIKPANAMDILDSLYAQATQRAAGGGGGGGGPDLGGRTMIEDQIPPYGGGYGGGGGGDLFRMGGAASSRAYPANKTLVTGPDGRMYWFGYLGKPVLFSGDVAAARRVHKTVTKYAKFVGLKAVRVGSGTTTRRRRRRR